MNNKLSQYFVFGLLDWTEKMSRTKARYTSTLIMKFTSFETPYPKKKLYLLLSPSIKTNLVINSSKMYTLLAFYISALTFSANHSQLLNY